MFVNVVIFDALNQFNKIYCTEFGLVLQFGQTNVGIKLSVNVIGLVDTIPYSPWAWKYLMIFNNGQEVKSFTKRSKAKGTAMRFILVNYVVKEDPKSNIQEQNKWAELKAHITYLLP